MQRTRRIMSKLGLALLIAASLPACVIRARGDFQTTGARVAYSQPPEPRAENYAPMAGQVWVRGHWSWNNNQWVWVNGRYEPIRQGYAWQDGRWEPRNGTWHWVDGQWVVSGSGTVVVGGDRPQVQDHRYPNGQPGNPQGGVIIGNPNGGVVTNPGGVVVGNPQGGVIIGNPNPPVGQGGVVVNNGQGGVIASNGAGTVVSSGGTVIIVPPGSPTIAPPPPRVETPGPGRRGHIWIAGSWNWNTNTRQYEWVPGHWGRVKANHVWQPPRWEQRGNAWVRIEGEWRVTIR